MFMFRFNTSSVMFMFGSTIARTKVRQGGFLHATEGRQARGHAIQPLVVDLALAALCLLQVRKVCRELTESMRCVEHAFAAAAATIVIILSFVMCKHTIIALPSSGLSEDNRHLFGLGVSVS
jgi:hypothetical protein